MRIFSLLAIIIVLAIVMYQAKTNVQGTGYDESGKKRTEQVKEQVDSVVSDYQKKLDEAMNKSGAE